MILIGIAAGLIAAFCGHDCSRVLYGIEATDTLTFVVVTQC